MDDFEDEDLELLDDVVEPEQSARATVAEKLTGSSGENVLVKRGVSHPVWNYFDYNDRGFSCAKCKDKKFSGRNTSNALKHLKSKHPDIFEEVVAIKKERDNQSVKKTEVKSQQLESAWKKLQLKQFYKKNSSDAIRCEKALRKMISNPMTSLSSYLSPHFREFCNELNPHFEVPKSRTKLVALLERPVASEKLQIGNEIKQSQSSGAAVTIDIWSGKNSNDSYLGVTAHYVYQNRLKSSLLGLKILKERHTAKTIKKAFEEVLEEAELNEDNVVRIVTDNGANMVAACRKETVLMMIEEERASTDEENDEIAEADLWDVLRYEKEEESITSKADQESETSKAEQESETSKAEQESETSKAEKDELYFEKENYEEQIASDMDMDSSVETILSVCFPHRISCVAHDLQLVLHHAIQKNMVAFDAITSLLELIKKIRRSKLATDQLNEKCGLHVILPVATRWNSWAMVVERFLKISASVRQTARAMGWGELQFTDDLYRSLLLVLGPIKKETDDLQGDKYVTLSRVYPAVKSLEAHMKKCQKVQLHESINMVLKRVTDEIQKRFAKVTCPTSPAFDPIYMVSTMLDPQIACSLDDTAKSIVSDALLVLCHGCYVEVPFRESEQVEMSSTSSCGSSETDGRVECEYSFNDYIEEVKRRKLTVCERRQKEPLAAAIANYIDSVFLAPPIGVDCSDPIAFWLNYKACAPLRTVALRFLCTPTSSAPVERIFSAAGLATEGRKCRTGCNLLESKLFSHINARLLSR